MALRDDIQALSPIHYWPMDESAGTTMAALAAGVPQVIVPLFAFDQRVNAEHVAAVGAGLQVDGGPGGMLAVPDAAIRLITESSYREAAGGVANAMAGLPPIGDSVTLLERRIT